LDGSWGGEGGKTTDELETSRGQRMVSRGDGGIVVSFGETYLDVQR